MNENHQETCKRQNPGYELNYTDDSGTANGRLFDVVESNESTVAVQEVDNSDTAA